LFVFKVILDTLAVARRAVALSLGEGWERVNRRIRNLQISMTSKFSFKAKLPTIISK
jgi:hypothetical protein